MYSEFLKKSFDSPTKHERRVLQLEAELNNLKTHTERLEAQITAAEPPISSSAAALNRLRHDDRIPEGAEGACTPVVAASPKDVQSLVLPSIAAPGAIAGAVAAARPNTQRRQSSLSGQHRVLIEHFEDRCGQLQQQMATKEAVASQQEQELKHAAHTAQVLVWDTEQALAQTKQQLAQAQAQLQQSIGSNAALCARVGELEVSLAAAENKVLSNGCWRAQAESAAILTTAADAEAAKANTAAAEAISRAQKAEVAKVKAAAQAQMVAAQAKVAAVRNAAAKARAAAQAKVAAAEAAKAMTAEALEAVTLQRDAETVQHAVTVQRLKTQIEVAVAERDAERDATAARYRDTVLSLTQELETEVASYELSADERTILESGDSSRIPEGAEAACTPVVAAAPEDVQSPTVPSIAASGAIAGAVAAERPDTQRRQSSVAGQHQVLIEHSEDRCGQLQQQMATQEAVASQQEQELKHAAHTAQVLVWDTEQALAQTKQQLAQAQAQLQQSIGSNAALCARVGELEVSLAAAENKVLSNGCWRAQAESAAILTTAADAEAAKANTAAAEAISRAQKAEVAKVKAAAQAQMVAAQAKVAAVRNAAAKARAAAQAKVAAAEAAKAMTAEALEAVTLQRDAETVQHAVTVQRLKTQIEVAVAERDAERDATAARYRDTVLSLTQELETEVASYELSADERTILESGDFREIHALVEQAQRSYLISPKSDRKRLKQQMGVLDAAVNQVYNKDKQAERVEN